MQIRRKIARLYIDYLADAALNKLLNLFSEEAVVTSPIYGQLNHKEFYTRLFKDTNDSTIKVNAIYEDDITGNIALHFDYEWTLKNKSKVKFEVVDIITFNSSDKITSLSIIYDTVQSRALVNNLRNEQ